MCAGSASAWTASGGASYVWSNAATTSAISVNAAGNYTVTVTDINSCTASSSKVLTIHVLPQASINGATEICAGEKETFIASGGISYLWNTGDVTKSIVADNEGAYAVTVTDANGCTSETSKYLK